MRTRIGTIVVTAVLELTATGNEVRQALVLILHDAAQPHTSMASDWKPKGLCQR